MPAAKTYDDDDSPYQMPEHTGRNILVFSDGTDASGGLFFDEARSNVYKLFRATRCGPDSIIDPGAQLAFYDPGLGSALAAREIKWGWKRWLYSKLSSATGWGITKNIEECYQFLLLNWRPGDRLFLFGFSRGAYTVRCLAGVLGLCGIPTISIGHTTFLRDPKVARKIAREAVRRVYRHGSGAEPKETDDQKTKERKQKRQRLLGVQRDALAKQFQDKYHSVGPHGSNAIPHFIGVWDTVASVGLNQPLRRLLVQVSTAILLGLSVYVAWRYAGAFNWLFVQYLLVWFASLGIVGFLLYQLLRVKFVTGLPGYPWYRTIHQISMRMEFFDRLLNPHVRYARHAIAIDECRADFNRVPWNPKNMKDVPNRKKEEGAWLKQIWFAGNHSDIGGSYSETESRLSDISLKWMANQAKKSGLLVNPTFLNLFGKHDGMQHDECRVGIKLWRFTMQWPVRLRKMDPEAILHPSVGDRFNETTVQIYDEDRAYRPTLLEAHKIWGPRF